jgi:hypothetical protein
LPSCAEAIAGTNAKTHAAAHTQKRAVNLTINPPGIQ